MLFTARGSELAEVCRVADEIRREVNGDEVAYVVNRNINYTNQCYFRCRFCAFSKEPQSLNLRGEPYLLDTTEVARGEVPGLPGASPRSPRILLCLVGYQPIG